ncbi:hypothetical protein BDV97DRAFT_354178 [Delphinella strobiligena]|nr:hypothetical protein BDV97DRAFT_354178 [Delphinella strobiligena]
MVSFWPFKGQDNSAASFEKLLSSLSTKITKETANNDKLRQRQKRFRVLWTLYTSFAYILVAIILILVTGWQNWTTLEYTGLAGAPLVIYGVRTALDASFNYRVAKSQNHLNDLHKQREAAIAKLKEATKYNSTQQLLEKYGGSPPKPPATKRRVSAGQDKQSSPRVQRTGLPPPPTANIPGRALPALPQNPLPPQQQSPPPPQQPQIADPQAEFAPNAFSVPSQQPPLQAQVVYANNGPSWFDKIMEAVLGEDETQSKNRIVLICSNCRLVNGQAPPGTQTLEDVGPWRCMACQTLNGQQSQAKEMIQKIVEAGDKNLIKRRATTLDGVGEHHASEHEEGDASSEVASVDENVAGGADDTDEADITSPASSTRSKVRRRKD